MEPALKAGTADSSLQRESRMAAPIFT